MVFDTKVCFSMNFKFCVYFKYEQMTYYKMYGIFFTLFYGCHKVIIRQDALKSLSLFLDIKPYV